MEGERKTVAAAARAKASGRLLRLSERRELRGIFRKVVFASRRSSTSSSAKQRDWINHGENYKYTTWPEHKWRNSPVMEFEKRLESFALLYSVFTVPSIGGFYRKLKSFHEQHLVEGKTEGRISDINFECENLWEDSSLCLETSTKKCSLRIPSLD